MTAGPSSTSSEGEPSGGSGPKLVHPYEGVIGRYALCRPFARGGMATVHLARQLSDEGFSRVVAVKRLHAHVAESPESLGMFLDEARLASRIRHSNVVPTLDVVSRDGELLIVMEYILGESLSALIKASLSEGQLLPVGISLRIAIDVLHGLHAAHRATDKDGTALGIVHRDVSPQNVLVGVDGVPRIVDFGIAKAAGRMQTTRNNKLKGKLAYMAPEQLERKRALDARVDVYATGIILWEMLAGRRLFRGEDEIDTFKKALHDQVVSPSLFNPEVSAPVSDIVLKALARDRDDRFLNAREFAAALESLHLAASSAALADWVGGIAGQSLGEARQRLSELERAPSIPAEAGPAFSSSPSWTETSVKSLVSAALAKNEAPTDIITTPQEIGATATMAAAGVPAMSRSKWAILLMLFIALGFAVLFFLPSEKAQLQAESPETDSENEPKKDETAAVADVGPAARENTVIAEQDQKNGAKEETGEASPSSDAEGTSPTKEPAVKAATRAKSPPRPAAPRPRRTVPVDECANPFTVDKEGVRVPKVHCL